MNLELIDLGDLELGEVDVTSLREVGDMPEIAALSCPSCVSCSRPT